jgi:hypothetical protein
LPLLTVQAAAAGCLARSPLRRKVAQVMHATDHQAR